MGKNAQALLSNLSAYQDLDIGQARALPMDMYTSEELFDLEKERIFRKEWVCVGRSEQVSQAGDYFSVEILGEPIVIVRGRDQILRALSAVCRHRYFSVADGAGNTNLFTCPYHKWVYDLDGTLRGAPHMEDVVDTNGNRCRLPELKLEIWFGFVFVSFNPHAQPLAPRLTGAADHWRNYDIENWRVNPWVDEVWPGNWKLAMETALEGYHVDGLHAQTFAQFMPSKSTAFEDTSEQWTLFRMDSVFEGNFAAYQPFADKMSGNDRTSVPQFGFFPNCAVSCTQMSSIWLTFLPLDVGHTRVIGGNLVHPLLYEQLCQSRDLENANTDSINAINAEDASAMVNLQRNAHSAYASPGLLCEKEKNLLWFYRYLSRMLGTAP